ncbi:MAG: hypothetical protein AAGH45_01155, partial [Pseudomonadota bacterium]
REEFAGRNIHQSAVFSQACNGRMPVGHNAPKGKMPPRTLNTKKPSASRALGLFFDLVTSAVQPT